MVAVMTGAIFPRPAKSLGDFDQAVYLTIAYDMERYGVFSNGVFDTADSTESMPSPGMSFGPVYPWIVLISMKIDARFAEAVRCAVENDRGHDDVNSCETYAAPVLLAHAFFLTIAILAIARAAELIFGGLRMFWLAASLSTLGLLPETDLFSFAMTESTTLFLYSVLALDMVLFYSTQLPRYVVAGGFLLGLLTLTRAEYVVLLPAFVALVFWYSTQRGRLRQALVFVAAFFVVLGPWIGRNAISVGKLGLSEEYGSASMIERFAFDEMTAKEYALIAAYCVGTIGAATVDGLFGEEAMRRFHYDKEGSFFAIGRGHRNELMAMYGKLDPIIWGEVRGEMARNWWRYILVTFPLAWCGMWVGLPVSLLIMPLFVLGVAHTVRTWNWLFLTYSVPAFVMLALHAAVANHYTRYNLILIGPFSIAAGHTLIWWTSWFLQSRAVISLGASGPRIRLRQLP